MYMGVIYYLVGVYVVWAIATPALAPHQSILLGGLCQNNNYKSKDNNDINSFELISNVPPALDEPVLEGVGFSHPFNATEIINAYVTAYSKTETCPHGKCITASGATPTPNKTVACPRRLPFGTTVEIEKRTYVCQDRTHVKFDGRFDVFMESYQEAINFGKKRLEVKIINK